MTICDCRFQAASLAAATTLLLLLVAARADDWPQWRGPNQDGVWRETGILETMPPHELKARWRVRIGTGYSGPVVADGRVFVTDGQLRPVVERVLGFEEQTGKPLGAYSSATGNSVVASVKLVGGGMRLDPRRPCPS